MGGVERVRRVHRQLARRHAGATVMPAGLAVVSAVVALAVLHGHPALDEPLKVTLPAPATLS